MVLKNNRFIGRFSRMLMTILLSVCLFDSALAANVKNVTGLLNLSATVNNQPAFSLVTWRINLKKPGVSGSRLVRQFSKHAVTVELEPGEYQIILSVGNRREIRTITIIESKQHSLVINVSQSSPVN